MLCLIGCNIMMTLKVYADGFAPKEIDFIVVDSHPTTLNVTLHSAKVSIL